MLQDCSTYDISGYKWVCFYCCRVMVLKVECKDIDLGPVGV